VIPIGKCDNYLFVVEVFVWGVRVVDYEGTAQAIGVLAPVVTVVPICAWLVDL